MDLWLYISFIEFLLKKLLYFVCNEPISKFISFYDILVTGERKKNIMYGTLLFKYDWHLGNFSFSKKKEKEREYLVSLSFGFDLFCQIYN